MNAARNKADYFMGDLLIAGLGLLAELEILVLIMR
jgi:hypothetical protein